MWIDRRTCWLFIAAGLAGFIGLQRSGQRAFATEPPGERAPVKPDAPKIVELSGEVVRRSKRATALVDLQQRGSGSAVCVSAEGFFITNHHVVQSLELGTSVRLVLNPGQADELTLKAQIIKVDEEEDLALLKADASPKLLALSLGADDELFETMPVTAFGYPFGRMLASEEAYPAVSVNTGTITALRNKKGKLSMIQVDAAVNPGNSGGPLVDRKGQVIGVIASGLPGARVNFAIPVSRVREFLAAPALVVRDPGIKFFEHTKSRRFEVNAYAYDPRALDDLQVELTLSTSENDQRTLKAQRAGDRFVVEGAACSPEEVPLKSVLVIHKGRGFVQADIPDGELAFGSRRLPWQQVASLVKDGDEWVVSLLNGERYAGKPVELPSVAWSKGRSTQLATADRIEVRLNQEPATRVDYQVQASRNDKVLTSVRGQFRIGDTPETLAPNFDRLRSRNDVTQPIVIEAVVPSVMKLQITPMGIVWIPQKGAEGGMEDERGRYVLVNGHHWYMEQAATRQPLDDGEQASLLPILLGGRDPQVYLLWARADMDSPHDGQRARLDVQKRTSESPFTATVKNEAPQSTRIALAITFDPLGPIYPLQPPRNQPVLESHWPLNDAGTTKVADLGAAKHPGRTSGPQMVPGLFGNGLDIERAAILCPGVLSVDRTDAFSCAAWMKGRPGQSGSVVSRMNGGLRGFDLGYGDSIQAHLISSWDGNAIRVRTIEHFDSSAWHQIAMTYDGSSQARGLKVYIDGALATLEISHDRLSESIRCDFPFAIGSREHRDHFQGSIDEVRAYDRVLSPEEIFEQFDLDRSGLSPAAESSLKLGLVGHWSFDGGPAESLQDKSGRGHHGQAEVDPDLPKVIESDGGQALRLEGMGFVDCGPVADFNRTDSYTLGVWFKSRGAGFACLMGTTVQSGRGFDMSFDGHIVCHLVSEWEGSAIRIVSRNTYPNDTWHHAVCTYDGSSRSKGFKIYVDGEEALFDASHDALTSSPQSHADFRLGSRVSREYFTGDLDEALVYWRALSGEEARSLYQRGRVNAPPLSSPLQKALAGYWNFEGKGNEAFRDRSRHRHDGRPALHESHSTIGPYGTTRVARFQSLGGIQCGAAGDFERTDAFSTGGWFVWEPGTSQSLVSKMLPVGPRRGYEIQFTGERLLVHLTHNWESTPQQTVWVQTAPYPATGWHHVFLTYDGSSRAAGLKLYVDGEPQPLEVSADNLSRSIRVAEPFCIGSRYTDTTMRGQASHVRLIPRALTAEEVRQLSKSDKPEGKMPANSTAR